MALLYELYIAHTVFWLIFLICGYLMPNTHSLRRPYAKTNVLYKLGINYCATLLVLPLAQIIPGWDVIWYVKYVVGILMAEMWFYYWHRLLHYKYLYKWHRDHHEYIAPYGITGLYCSVPEMLLVNLASILIPCQVLKFASYELYIFAILIAISVLKGHGGLQKYGYNSWLSSEKHDLHHQFMNVNYGLLYITDIIHGTYR